MQQLTQAPRGNLTAAQVAALIVGDGVTITSGLELLDSTNTVLSDISDRLEKGTVERHNFANIHGTCTLEIEGSLAWGRDRVRPYMTLSNNNVSARFNLGVFVLVTPASARGEDPIIYSVSGFDLLFLLQVGPSDTYVVASGVTYFSAIQAVVTASGIGATLQLDSTAQAKVLPNAMVWAVAPGLTTSWLDIINDLLSAISYRGLWADENGTLHSVPYLAPSARPVEWVLDTSNNLTNIVGEQRTLTSDVWNAHNWWRFVMTPVTATPTEGVGMYTPQNPATGRTSQAALNRIVKAPLVYLAAADQASLQAQGDAIVAAEQAISRGFTMSIDPLPIAGHFDIVQFTDDSETDKCQVVSWVIDLEGFSAQWVMESVTA